jgi:hypothetical protein
MRKDLVMDNQREQHKAASYERLARLSDAVLARCYSARVRAYRANRRELAGRLLVQARAPSFRKQSAHAP